MMRFILIYSGARASHWSQCAPDLSGLGSASTVGSSSEPVVPLAQTSTIPEDDCIGDSFRRSCKESGTDVAAR